MRTALASDRNPQPSTAVDRLLAIFADFETCSNFCYRHPAGDLRFSDLHEQVLALLGRLRAVAEARNPVLIWGHKDPSYLVAYWACLVSGRALVPVEPETPLDRVRQIAQACDASALLIAAPHGDPTQALQSLDVAIPIIEIGVDVESSRIKHPGHLRALATSGIADDDVAYIMFSSGTLGQPKGIQVTYANLVDFIDWLDVLLPEAATFSAVSGNIRYCFDVSLFEIWTSWLHRLPITALDHADIANSTGYIRRLASDKVSLWVSTPSIVRLFLKNRRFCSDSLPDCATFVFCGEPLTKAIVNDLFQRFPGCRVVNTYGPTECTVAVTSVDITNDHLLAEHELPIGYARAGTSIGHSPGIDAIDQAQEIYVRGASVGRGYVGLPERQEYAFPERDLYRTGDWGWKAADGLWYFKGRIDREVKIQGVRIALDDVEAHIRAQPGVEEVVVSIFSLDDQPRALNAYVLGPQSDDGLRLLAGRLSEQLPHYLVPRFWYAGFEVTLNKNSKLDRNAIITAGANAALRYVHPSLASA
ncbi:D-alanine--poly(phosphoribitol) ligase subunit 1 [Rhizobium mongolense subsp. loessense]|uniref:D-alanine--poly(Phosphoribitol) ligase subunit 1 n=1 Tax=Rhizobium mongolense subsp. loessense TaxID=158890 RepID=A0A1G4U595_9HYPH|nr:AMP-binding protein [Rhizobium mongolense]SCW88813.1 D-alanine--poly(phosphoribitol) ligase subunit 1 [Rhizobium mongolense subsp. loessense]